jgi:hypothetical protein
VSGFQGARRAAAGAVLYALFCFLSVAGLVAVAFGVLYRLDAGQVPHLLQGSDRMRGSFLLVTGGACLLVAWLLRRWQKRSLTGSALGLGSPHAVRTPDGGAVPVVH